MKVSINWPIRCSNSLRKQDVNESINVTARSVSVRSSTGRSWGWSIAKLGDWHFVEHILKRSTAMALLRPPHSTNPNQRFPDRFLHHLLRAIWEAQLPGICAVFKRAWKSFILYYHTLFVN